jgi:hypothetical protein
MQKGERKVRKEERKKESLPDLVHFWYIAFISCFIPESYSCMTSFVIIL